MTRCPELAILQAKWRLHEGGFVSCVAYPRAAHRRSSPKPNTPIEERLADEARFFRSWLDNPAIAGAVSPSGVSGAYDGALCRSTESGPIVELGPGTGAITEALLERGIAPGRLFLVEFDPGFCKLLKRRFPGIHVIKGDAYNLTETLGTGSGGRPPRSCQACRSY